MPVDGLALLATDRRPRFTSTRRPNTAARSLDPSPTVNRYAGRFLGPVLVVDRALVDCRTLQDGFDRRCALMGSLADRLTNSRRARARPMVM